jgi:MurNAc alpha-1-phosphate uridylyltransferase
MIAVPRHAMVLAAGLGTRLRPVTDTLPKPLVELNGRTLLDHAIDRLVDAGVGHVVVNTHYMAAKIAAQLARRTAPRIDYSVEPELLETGGGVANALPLLGETFFVVNADVFWLDGKQPALLRLARAFDPERMDAALLLQRTVTAVGYDGRGDYLLDPAGTPRRRREREIAPFLFAGIQLLHRRLFDNWAERAFSLVRLFDRAQAAGRLHAIVHEGEWYHIGTPAGLAATRERLASRRIER